MKKRTSGTGAKIDFFSFYKTELRTAITARVPEAMHGEVTEAFMRNLAEAVKQLYTELSETTEIPSTSGHSIPFKFTRTESFVFGVCAAFICNNILEYPNKIRPSTINFKFISADAKRLLISPRADDAKTLLLLKTAHATVFVGDVADKAVHAAAGDRTNPFARFSGLSPSESTVDDEAKLAAIEKASRTFQNLDVEEEA